MKTKRLLIVTSSCYDINTESLYDVDSQKLLYSISDMWDCPEDATIDRALQSAYDATNLIQLGIKYHIEGYDKIEIARACTDKDVEEFIDDYFKQK